jgi:hypothetical protein
MLEVRLAHLSIRMAHRFAAHDGQEQLYQFLPIAGFFPDAPGERD